MPFQLQKSGSGYFVIDDAGKKYSKKPLPKKRAEAQMKALYANVPDAEKKEVSATPTAVMAQGQGSLFGGTGVGGARKKLAKIAKKERAIDCVPPEEVIESAKRGYTLKQNNIGTGTGAANVRCESIVAGEAQEPGTIYRMSVYFDRNRKTKDDDRVTWLMMGGDAGDEWSHKIVTELKELRREKEILLDEYDYEIPIMNATIAPESMFIPEEGDYEEDEYAEIADLEGEEILEPEDAGFLSEEETGVMVAFFIPAENAIDLASAVPSPVPASDMHITLAYLGDITDGELDKAETISAIGKFVSHAACVAGKTNGFGRFHGKYNELDAIYANFDAPQLPEFRQKLVECLEGSGVTYSKDHGYTPHITLSYIGIDDEMPDVHIPDMSIKFDTIWLAWGEERIPFKLQNNVISHMKEFINSLIRNKEKKLKREQDGTRSQSQYLVVEDPEKPSTWHLPVYNADGELDHRRMGAAWAALHEGYRGNKYQGAKKGDAIKKLMKLYEQEGMPVPGQPAEVEQKKEFDRMVEIAKTAKKENGGGVVVYKQANGQYRWVTLSSNGFRDRDGEIVSTKALAEDCERADREKDYGTLRWWHVPGLDIGDCDFNMIHGHMLIESGTFKSPEIAETVKEEQDGLEISIGFTHPSSEPDKDGVFNQIRRFERSLVPKGRVSNRFTSLMTFES